jgi:hypothetical protein
MCHRWWLYIPFETLHLFHLVFRNEIKADFILFFEMFFCITYLVQRIYIKLKYWDEIQSGRIIPHVHCLCTGIYTVSMFLVIIKFFEVYMSACVLK